MPHQALTGVDVPGMGRAGPPAPGQPGSRPRSTQRREKRRRWRVRRRRPGASSTGSLVAWGRTGRGRQDLGQPLRPPASPSRPDRSGASGMWCARRRCVRPRPDGCADRAQRPVRRSRRGPAAEASPTPPAQAQSGVLQLRFGRRHRCRELAEHLCVRVQGVAGGAPGLVGQRARSRRHSRHYMRSPNPARAYAAFRYQARGHPRGRPDPDVSCHVEFGAVCDRSSSRSGASGFRGRRIKGPAVAS